MHPVKPLFATCSDDTFINVWELPNSEELKVNLHSSTRCNDFQLTGLCFAPDSSEKYDKIVATVYSYKTIVVKSL